GLTTSNRWQMPALPRPPQAHTRVMAACSAWPQPSSRPVGTGWLPLPGEVVADVGVAVGGIKPQAPVEWKRLIQLIDLGAGVGDGRRNVNAGRWLGQRQRWWS